MKLEAFRERQRSAPEPEPPTARSMSIAERIHRYNEALARSLETPCPDDCWLMTDVQGNPVVIRHTEWHAGIDLKVSTDSAAAVRMLRIKWEHWRVWQLQRGVDIAAFYRLHLSSCNDPPRIVISYYDAVLHSRDDAAAAYHRAKAIAAVDAIRDSKP